MPIKLQNIHTGELWVKSDSEVCARFIHSSDIIFDIEYDDSLSIWKYPDRFAECVNSSVMLIDENPVPYRAWTINFFFRHGYHFYSSIFCHRKNNRH